MAIVDRVSTPRIELSEAFNPRAEIVDAYVRPATPPKSPLWDLAEGLQSFSASLKGLMSKRQAEADANADKLGEAQFYKDNSVGYAEAVRTGKLGAHQSPEFIAGYKKAEGRLMGQRLVSKFELEYSQWGGRNDTDPAAFDQFLSGFLAENLGTDDPDVLAGALPYVNQITERGYGLNSQERADGVYNGSLDAHVAGSDEDIDMAIMAGTANGGEMDRESLWEALLASREAALSTGIRDEDYDKKLIDLIIFKAQETGDTELLKLLDNEVPGAGHTYAQTQYGREQMALAEQGIDVAKRQAEERDYTAQTRADEAMKDQMEAFAVEKLAEDPNFAFDEKFLVEYQKYDPQARINIKEWSKKLSEGVPEDQAEVMELYDRILKGEDPSAVVRAGMDAGIIRTPETMKGLLSFKKPVADVSRFTQNPVYKSSLGALRTAATPEQTFYNPDAASPAAVAIQLDFEKAMTRYLEGNPQASDLEISEEAARVYGILQKGITEPGQYATPLAAGVDQNPLVPNEQQVADQAKAQEEFAASPAGQAAEWAADTPPALDALPEEERRQIEEAAGSMGIDPEVLKDRIWEEVQRSLDGNDALGEEIGGIIDSAVPEPVDEEPNADLSGTPFNPTEAPGLVEPGNIDLDNRQVVQNDDGSISTEESISFEEDGVEVLIPTVFDGAHHSDEEAIEHYRQTGEHLGKFESPEAAEAFADSLHERQDRFYQPRPEKSSDPEVAKVAPVLNLLGVSEGTDRGDGYDETLAYGMLTDGKAGGKRMDVDLTTMTLNEVRALQRKMLTDPDNKWNSSAVGRYQIVGKTLRGLIRRMGLSGNELFTPELQDRMALELLKMRGLEKWMAGEISTKRFVANIAKEWASLPKADGTKTYLDQGLGTDAATLIKALHTIRA